jgi:hypothetical protein
VEGRLAMICQLQFPAIWREIHMLHYQLIVSRAIRRVESEQSGHLSIGGPGKAESMTKDPYFQACFQVFSRSTSALHFAAGFSVDLHFACSKVPSLSKITKQSVPCERMIQALDEETFPRLETSLITSDNG